MLVLGLAIACTGCASIERQLVLTVTEVAALQSSPDFREAVSQTTPLKVMTLNVAHGRLDGTHQLWQFAGRHRRNLDSVSAVLRRESPHVVALQEADGPSAWSGRFNHVDYLAQAGGFRFFIQAEHDRFPALSYGTAILSQFRLHDPLAVTFSRTTFPSSKGFVISSLAWPGRPDVEIDIVSVHLDAYNAQIRRHQIAELTKVIESRSRPLVVMGDFNTVWRARTRLLQKLAGQFQLSTFKPTSAALVTYPGLDRRLDWIFVSSELAIHSYETLPDTLSDHRAVVAEILLRTDPCCEIARAQ